MKKPSCNIIEEPQKTILERTLDYNGILARDRELFLSGEFNLKKNENIYMRFADKIRKTIANNRAIKIFASNKKESLIPAILLKRCFNVFKYEKVEIVNSVAQINKKDLLIFINKDTPEKTLKRKNIKLRDVIVIKDSFNPGFYTEGIPSKRQALFHVWMIMFYLAKKLNKYYEDRIEKELLYYSIFSHTLNSYVVNEARALYLKGVSVANKVSDPIINGFLKFANQKNMNKLAIKYFGESILFLFMLNYKMDNIIMFLTNSSEKMSFNNFLFLKTEVSVIKDEILDLENSLLRSLRIQKGLINEPILVATAYDKVYKRTDLASLSLKRFYKVFKKPIIFSIRESKGFIQYAIGLNGINDYGGHVEDGIWEFKLSKDDRVLMKDFSKYDVTKIKNRKYIRIDLDEVIEASFDVDHLSPYGNGFIEPEFEVITNNKSVKGKIKDVIRELNL